MRDTELYRHLLGLLEPWTVEHVELNVPEQRIDVWTAHPPGRPWACPKCGGERPLYDHADERVWRHLDSCQFLEKLKGEKLKGTDLFSGGQRAQPLTCNNLMLRSDP